MVQHIEGKEVKENIIKFLNEKGPSLPIPISKRIGISSLFTSAFLSEMASEGLIKISHMKIGGSPLYYTPEKVNMLENFSNYLSAKEKEALEILKKEGVILDENQHPAIRVALRGLKDFAIPFKQNEKIFWRYFLYEEPKAETKIQTEEKPPLEIRTEEKKIEIKPEIKMEPEREETRRGIIPEIRIPEEKKEKTKLKIKKEKPKPEKYLNEVKAFLESKKAEILNIEEFNNKRVIARIKMGVTECLLFAYNKKRISEKEMIKAWKKSSYINLPYYILTREESSKKMKETIEAYRNLFGTDKLPA